VAATMPTEYPSAYHVRRALELCGTSDVECSGNND
jgi:hypothetical protein